MYLVKRIISGGQTGVDRAALDVALDVGVTCGGWCPKGRRAADGRIPDKYPLKETDTEGYNKRTRLNVKESDGTLIFNRGLLEGGTSFTVNLTKKYKKPCLIVDVEHPVPASKFRVWLNANAIQTLNVAGPREEGRPGIYLQVQALLKDYLSNN